MITFGEYRPDQSSFQAKSTQYLSNVLPRGDGYGPFSDFSVLTSALAATCRGYFYARKADGSISVFAATATKLYNLDNTNLTWTDVSKALGTYTDVSIDDQWQFAQFNNFVFAVQANTVPQVFNLTSSTEFADLGGSPPQARYIAIVNRFVVLSGLGTSTPYRIQWSGFNATTTWTAGVNSSDFQDLPDGGIVRGVAGGEYGVISQDAGMRRMIFSPGSPVVFQIERIAEEKGIFAPLSMTRSGDRVFYISTDGFKMVLPGAGPQAIGKERVDRTFFSDVDTSYLRMCIGASDPRNSRVYFAYKSVAGTPGLFDKLLCYDWALDRWSPITTSGEYIATLAAPGITLENLDSISASIDALAFSLDDISTSVLSNLSAVNSAHKIGFYSGSPLEATLDTPEQGGWNRVRVKGFRPATDAGTCYGSIGARERQQDSVTYSTEQALNVRGLVPANVSTRLARGRLRIPAAATWTFASGIEPDFSAEGAR